ncbi:MAG: replication factor C large subunit [Candidatus Aenigmatarchaeota archaeon]|nr:MAG: replication factor C large subunit [Candidatus Aenigmarchaeota archaeon]
MQLWTDKHKPETTEDMAGQDQPLFEAKRFLKSWKPGTGLIFFGPPGTGKTIMAEMLAKERGDFLVHMDASDTRSASEIEGTLSEATKQQTLFHKGKIILMDEVDSMSGRSDRGGAGSIAKIIAESKFPVIVCVNDIKDPKLRQIKKVSRRVKFGPVDRHDIAKFLRRIAKKERIKVGDEVLNGLARWSDGDVRSAVLDFQMLSLGKKEIDEESFTSIGFRERRKELEDVLMGLMRTPSISANRNAIRNADTDPDDLFLWLESNIYRTSSDPGFIADAYDHLSIADIYRGRVMSQQNWRFKAYMIDIMSGIASLRKGEFIKPETIRTPDRIIMLARTRFKRMVMEPVVRKLAEHTHCSMRTANFDYMPFLMFLAKKGFVPEELELTPEELDALKKY